MALSFEDYDFDWDSGNAQKCVKHGVSTREIEVLFSLTPVVAPDNRHSAVEKRLIAVGKGDGGRPLFVVFTIRILRERRFVRPISARYMHAKEYDYYAQTGS